MTLLLLLTMTMMMMMMGGMQVQVYPAVSQVVDWVQVNERE